MGDLDSAVIGPLRPTSWRVREEQRPATRPTRREQTAEQNTGDEHDDDDSKHQVDTFI